MTGHADFSLEMLHRASVVAQTRISFSREQLLQLIHEYLSSQASRVTLKLLVRTTSVLKPNVILVQKKVCLMIYTLFQILVL